ncbi:hypothetical protein ACOTHJ_13275 [Achromobacter xylosoxidans]
MSNINEGKVNSNNVPSNENPQLLDTPTKVVLCICAVISLICAGVLFDKHSDRVAYESQYMDIPQPKTSTVMVLDGVVYLIRPNNLKPVSVREPVRDDAAMVAKKALYRPVETQMRHLTIRQEREFAQNTNALYGKN